MYFGMDILSGTRAYVGGEGLWSKAQKQAVLRLGHYAWSHDEKDYQEYLAALEIPLGDHQARVALEESRLDYNAAATGFLRGGNHPKDIPSMIHLFRRFRHVSYINEAIAFWTQGDSDIAELQTVGDQIHHEMTSRSMSLMRLERLLKQVQEINAKVTPLENGFSSTLGQGARWVTHVLFVAMALTTGIFLAVTLVISYQISRHLCDEIDHLRHGAARIANGDYNVTFTIGSKDEIGELALSFQQMVVQRQRVEKLKDELYANVVSVNKELEAFSYSVSHDLRTPLRAIDGFSKELLDNCPTTLDERSREDLGRIRAATKRMGQIIDDLLELSHLSRSEFKSEKVDLSAMVREIAQKLTDVTPSRAVEFAIAPQVIAEGDPGLLRIALENLIQNSWKFTQRQEQPKIEFGVFDQDLKNEFFVRDNGAGFNMAYAEKLFKPFQRLHDPKEFPGTGIGLAIVQRIIHRHGGKIWAEAEENHGAAFYFTLS